MTTTDTDTFEHAHFCLPRPGNDEPRMESYSLPRIAPDGTPDGQILIVRCQECGRRTVDGALDRAWT